MSPSSAICCVTLGKLLSSLCLGFLIYEMEIIVPASYCFDSSVGKESACNAGDPSLIPGLGRSSGEGIGYPLQYSDLENSMNYIILGVTKSWTRLSNFHFHTVLLYFEDQMSWYW